VCADPIDRLQAYRLSISNISMTERRESKTNRTMFPQLTCRAAVGMGIPMGIPMGMGMVYGYGDCDESPWVLWVICGDF